MVVIEIYRDIKVVSTRLGSSRSAGCLIRRPRTLIFSSLHRLAYASSGVENHALVS